MDQRHSRSKVDKEAKDETILGKKSLEVEFTPMDLVDFDVRYWQKKRFLWKRLRQPKILLVELRWSRGRKVGSKMKYYIADTHFGHKNVLTFDSRPFSDVEEMDREMIRLWNSMVRSEDEVYIVGDFAYHNERPAEWYLARLQGRKYLIIGNHDGKLLKNERAMGYFEGADKMMHVFDDGYQICVCHFPLAEWNGFYRGALHIYGHIHNRQEETWEFMKTRQRAYNAGCMLHGYRPVTLKELIGK